MKVHNRIQAISAQRIKLVYKDVSGQFKNNLGKMRNSAFREASGDIVVFMDDDAFEFAQPSPSKLISSMMLFWSTRK